MLNGLAQQLPAAFPWRLRIEGHSDSRPCVRTSASRPIGISRRRAQSACCDFWYRAGCQKTACPRSVWPMPSCVIAVTVRRRIAATGG